MPGTWSVAALSLIHICSGGACIQFRVRPLHFTARIPEGTDEQPDGEHGLELEVFQEIPLAVHLSLIHI